MNPADFVLIRAGRACILPPPLESGSLMANLERNESCIFWLQPKGGRVEDQFASVNVNGKFYYLNSKMEKAVFRNVRLTKDFRNYEFLADGTKKLRIPLRLFREKIRTSVRLNTEVSIYVYKNCSHASLYLTLCLVQAMTDSKSVNNTAHSALDCKTTDAFRDTILPAQHSNSTPSIESPTACSQDTVDTTLRTKRARSYLRRKKMGTSNINVEAVFEKIRQEAERTTIVLSDEEYLQELWKIYRNHFQGQYTFPMFEKFIQSDSR